MGYMEQELKRRVDRNLCAFSMSDGVNGKASDCRAPRKTSVETHGELWYNHLVHLSWKIRCSKTEVNAVHLANGGKR